MLKADIKLESPEKPAGKRRGGRLQNLSFALLLIVPLLTPIAFAPSFPLEWAKTALFGLSTLLAFIVWIIFRLKDGTLVFPASGALLAGALTVAVSFLSALFSGFLATSFAGEAAETSSALMLAIFFLLLFLVSLLFNSKQRIIYGYFVFFGVFLLVVIFQILRLAFGPDFLSFGIFNSTISNTVGRWNDLAIFFGAGAILSLVTVELVSLSRGFKVLAYAALAVSLFFLALVNFSQIWPVLAVFSLIFLVYVISFGKANSGGRSLDVQGSAENPAEGFSGNGSSERKIPAASLIVLLLSLVFILAGGPLGNAISNQFNVSQIDARPSFAATFAIAKETLARDPILGAGPNRFVNNWLLYKPDGVNQTIFWNVDFNSGVGFLPTFIVTLGLLGALSWFLFLVAFLLAGCKAILSSGGDKASRYLASSSFLTALFLWLANIFYTPGVSILVLTFFFTGLFIASLSEGGFVRMKTVSFADNPRKGFVSVLVLVLFLIGAASASYLLIQKFAAAAYFQKGLLAFSSSGNLDSAEKNILKAVGISETAAEYRALAQIDLVRMSGLFSNPPSNLSAEAIRSEFQRLLTSALDRAGAAVAADRSDYRNWLAIGQVYEAVVPLRIQNAYESSLNAYKQALSLNPKSPAIYLALARLEAARGDDAASKSFIAEALKQKGNYTEAIFLLSQLQVREGNLKDAIASVEAAGVLAPRDSGVFFELGLLRYNNKDYEGAASALERAIALNPSYANAKYFLGLSYEKLGREADAIKQFSDLKATNPDNGEVDLILRNLKAGRAPFSSAAPPIDDKPEKRSKLPVKETEPARTSAEDEE